MWLLVWVWGREELLIFFCYFGKGGALLNGYVRRRRRRLLYILLIPHAQSLGKKLAEKKVDFFARLSTRLSTR